MARMSVRARAVSFWASTKSSPRVEGRENGKQAALAVGGHVVARVGGLLVHADLQRVLVGASATVDLRFQRTATFSG